jgi:phenylalanyl-tRNA synthetase beta chain
MKLSLNWLKDYISPGLSTEKLVHKLTIAGFEVEKVSAVSGDTVFDLEITPNRSDCLSILGIARDLGAILNVPCRFPKIKKRVWPKTKCAVLVEDKQGCPRYIGTLIEDIVIKKTPERMMIRLTALGARPVNNVVDITNFCLIESGQPLHAFDYDKLIGGKIIVRRARKGEKLITIDNVERELDSSVLVVADEKRPVAIAGIMGGKDTEVTEQTKNILLESAYFDPVLIRRTVRKLGLNSDSAYRFERGVDEAMVETRADRAIDLILENANGKITKRSEVVAATRKISAKPIAISTGQMNASIGVELSTGQYKNILKRLAFNVLVGKEGSFKVLPPSFRRDIKEAVDIIEDVSRIIGYDEVPLSFPQIKAATILSDSKRDAQCVVRNLFTAQGYNEVITYTMISRKCLAQSHQADMPALDIVNPLTQDQEIMRPSLLPGLLSVLRANLNRGQKNIRFFEIGKIYTVKAEKDTFGIIMTGVRAEDWRQAKKEEVDFYDLKGSLEQTFSRVGVKSDKVQFVSQGTGFLSTGQSAAIIIEGIQVGLAGKVEGAVLDAWTIKAKQVFFAQVDMEAFYPQEIGRRAYKAVSEVPLISRDISMAVKTHLTVRMVEETIRQAISAQNQVALMDIKFIERYAGEKIPQGHRGLVFSLTYQSPEAKTLRDEEVARVHDRVCEVLVKELGVIRR